MAQDNCIAIAKPAYAGQNSEALDSLMAAHPAEEVVAGIACQYWDDPAGCWDSVARAKSLACPAKEISTVGIFQYRMGIGGAERVVAEQVKTFSDMGFDVVFFAEEPQSRCKQELPTNVTWVQLPPSDRVKARSYPKRAAAIANAVRAHHVDVLIHNQWWNPLIAWDSMLFKALGVPVCLVCHSVYMLMFHEANPREFDHSRIFRYLDGLIALSQFDQQFWQRFNPRVFQANNPITIMPHKSQRSALTSKDIVWVGRLTDFDKQPAEAIEIFARVAPRCPDSTLTIVGASSRKRELDALKSLARRLKVEDRVRFTQPGADVQRFYREASVYLITSRLEGWSLTLAESKAFGLPCVMYALDYLTLTKDRRGILAVPQGDREGAARAICELLEDSALRSELGEQAFDHIVELSQFDFAAFWKGALDELAQGSPERAGFELDDAQWNLLLEGFKESVEKALNPTVRSLAKRTALNLADAVKRRGR